MTTSPEIFLFMVSPQTAICGNEALTAKQRGGGLELFALSPPDGDCCFRQEKGKGRRAQMRRSS